MTTFKIELQDDFKDTFEDAQADIQQSGIVREYIKALLPYLTMNDALKLAGEVAAFNNEHF